uniref:Uncharacterized protein n=1 Tax=Arundo donax TaxID=35708 RepID=A0A0A8XXZ6_ARUDO
MDKHVEITASSNEIIRVCNSSIVSRTLSACSLSCSPDSSFCSNAMYFLYWSLAHSSSLTNL